MLTRPLICKVLDKGEFSSAEKQKELQRFVSYILEVKELFLSSTGR